MHNEKHQLTLESATANVDLLVLRTKFVPGVSEVMDSCGASD